MNDTYITINNIAEGYYTEKRSKFYAFAHHVTSADEVKELFQKYKNIMMRVMFAMPTVWDRKVRSFVQMTMENLQVLPVNQYSVFYLVQA